MNEYIYILTGRVIPERALLDISEVPFSVPESDDIPKGNLFIEIIKSQLFAKFVGTAEIRNIHTLKNLVEDAARIPLDVAGYFKGYSYDAEIVQVIRPDSSDKYVFGIDIPALHGNCEKAGVSLEDIFGVVTGADSRYFRNALADVREAMRSPRDTGFFCYRAIETLKNCWIARKGLAADGNDEWKWEKFRNEHSIPKQQIMDIKAFADEVRHGNYSEVLPIADQDRGRIFKSTWDIMNKFISKEREDVDPTARSL